MRKITCLVIISLFCLSSILPAVAYVNINDTKFSDFAKVCSLSNWIEIQKLGVPCASGFGCSVSLNGDTALIGMSESAFVFIYNGTEWIRQAKLTASDGGVSFIGFGKSVSLSGDTALIGAPMYDDGRGSAYVFTRSGNTWLEQAKLTASDGVPDGFFGRSISLSGDTALIGAYDDGRGSAYVFAHNGNTWLEQAKLTVLEETSGDVYGVCVSLSGDTALIGTSWDDDGRGSAYIFTQSGTAWVQQAKITSSDGEESDYFGRSVSLYGDTALIGARGNDDKGSAYVFVRSGNTWLEQAKLTASDGATDDVFGYSVGLSGDTALIGAYGDDDNGYASGSAYVFTRSGNTWLEQAKLTASDGASFDVFGYSVSMDDGDTALIGALYQSDVEPYFGAAYIFAKNKHSPDKPTITGQVNGKPNIEYEYKFVSTDPDEDAIEYCIDWGDNSSEVCIGPYPSGAEASAKHAWSEEGSYIMKAKARDVYGAESDWVILEVSMPKSKVNYKFINNAIVERTSYATVEDDDEPPYTHLYYDTATGEVTLIAVDYPIGGQWSGVKATYYKIDSGDFEVYTSPFILPEGIHTVYFYSEDIMGNIETVKSKTLSLDTTPPTVSITSPEEGSLYLFGSLLMDRVLSDTTLCIGIVPVAATADDNGGTGVNKVLFSYNGETGWDDTAPYEDVFTGRVFGDLTISVTAIDNLGHESDPVEMTIRCYSLG